MKNLLKILASVTLLGSLAFASCDPKKGEDEKPTPVLQASPSKLPPEGGTVTFTTTVEGSPAVGAVITNETTGEVLAGNTWSATGEGQWQFFATVDGKESERVTVVAGDVFYRHILLTKFTYTLCEPCVWAQQSFDSMPATQQEHFVVLAVHGNSDPLEIPVGEALRREYGVSSFPVWYFNFGRFLTSSGPEPTNVNPTSLANQITYAQQINPAICGIKAVSTLEGRDATVNATVKFQQGGNFRIGCALVEDVPLEALNGQGRMPVFNNALRSDTKEMRNGMGITTNLTGNDVIPAVTPGEERTFTFNVTLDEAWDAEKCSFVIYVFYQQGTTANYVVNNALECLVGGDTGGYKYVQ